MIDFQMFFVNFVLAFKLRTTCNMPRCTCQSFFYAIVHCDLIKYIILYDITLSLVLRILKCSFKLLYEVDKLHTIFFIVICMYLKYYLILTTIYQIKFVLHEYVFLMRVSTFQHCSYSYH